MATQEEKQAAVQDGANAFAALELGLDQQKALVDAVIATVETGYALGIGKQGEFIRVKNRLERVRGEVSGVLADVVEIHEKCTSVAVREACDVPANFAIDGGISPMGGTR